MSYISASVLFSYSDAPIQTASGSSSLITGSLYFNTTSGSAYIWDGIKWASNTQTASYSPTRQKVVSLIYSDEIPTTGTATNTSAKSTLVDVTGYTSVIIETEIKLTQAGNTTCDVTFDLISNTTTTRSTGLRSPTTGAVKLGGAMKVSVPTSSASMPFTASASVGAGSGTWSFDSLRIYGVT